MKVKILNKTGKMGVVKVISLGMCDAKTTTAAVEGKDFEPFEDELIFDMGEMFKIIRVVILNPKTGN